MAAVVRWPSYHLSAGGSIVLKQMPHASFIAAIQDEKRSDGITAHTPTQDLGILLAPAITRLY